MAFRWIHLSDIHTLLGGSAEDNRVKTAFYEKLSKIPEADSIVITGDVFNKSNPADVKGLEDFISKLCFKLNVKNRKEVFFCPGNHDLIRSAALKTLKTENDIPSFETRENILTGLGIKDRFSVDNTKLFAEEAFASFNAVISLATKNDTYNYGEYMLFKPEIDGEIGVDFPLFVGINTALYAGRPYNKKAALEKLEEARGSLREIEARLFTKEDDAEKAMNACDDIVRNVRILCGSEADDHEKLCFISETAEKKLRADIEESTGCGKRLVVFFGHHPIEWMNKEAKQHFANLIDGVSNTKIYLCGHIHRPRVENNEIVFSCSNPENIKEFAVGGVFADKVQHAWPSFIEYSLEPQKTNRLVHYTLKCKIHYCKKNEINGGFLWQQLEETIEWDSTMPDTGAFGDSQVETVKIPEKNVLDSEVKSDKENTAEETVKIPEKNVLDSEVKSDKENTAEWWKIRLG